jgi:hypothetical protein
LFHDGGYLRLLGEEQGDEPQLGVGAVQQGHLVQENAVQVGQAQKGQGRFDAAFGWGAWINHQGAPRPVGAVLAQIQDDLAEKAQVKSLVRLELRLDE